MYDEAKGRWGSLVPTIRQSKGLQCEPCASDGSFSSLPFSLCFSEKQHFPQKLFDSVCERLSVLDAHQHHPRRYDFQGLNFVTKKSRRNKKKLAVDAKFSNEIFRRWTNLLDSIIQSPWMDEANGGDIMPGIQLIKFPFFELLSANFTRFASVHFRVLSFHQTELPGWIQLSANSVEKRAEFLEFLGLKSQKRMINVITLGVEERLGNESTRIDNLAIGNAINPRLNLIRKGKRGKGSRP